MMKARGFTIVELLVVIVVIGILAAITVVGFNGVSARATDVRIQSDIKNVHTLIEAYAARNGSYPSTGDISNVYTDSNCQLATDNNGMRTANWVPDLGQEIPQNPGLSGRGLNRNGGCYTYGSNGTIYILSAWNAKQTSSTQTMFRKTGWRETGFFNSNGYNCDHPNIQGYYGYSYTISNITDCP